MQVRGPPMIRFTVTVDSPWRTSTSRVTRRGYPSSDRRALAEPSDPMVVTQQFLESICRHLEVNGI